MEKEGIIKFSIKIIDNFLSFDLDRIKELNFWRTKLFELKLVGFDPIDNVGYGNLSQKLNNDNNFVITGSQTGHIAELTLRNYSEVINFNLESQSLSYKGTVKSSSESLTHASLYLANSEIKYVFHIHNNKIWNYLIENNFPATSTEVTYGTKEMANEVNNLVKTNKGIIVMKGHKDGIISYGPSAKIAGEALINLL